MNDDSHGKSISDADLELLDLVLDDDSMEEDRSSITVADRSEQLPLSFTQERIWFLDQLEGSVAYHMPDVHRLRGRLDMALLKESFSEIVKRHEVLRTTLPSRDGQPSQVIGEPVATALAIVDLESLPAQELKVESERLVREAVARPFDLAQGPLFHIALLRLADQDHILTLNIHHIVSDGWSIEIIHRELAAHYNAGLAGRPSALPELPVQYADYAAWQRQWLQVEEEIEYWREQLAGTLPLELPADRARPPKQSHRGATVEHRLPVDVVRGIRALGMREGATLFMTLLSAFKVLLSRHSGQQDISVGTPIAGRQHVDLENLIGFFVSMLVLRTDLDGDPSFVALLRRVRETYLGAFEHQNLPFEKLLAELQPERDLSRTPFFQVLFNMINIPQVPLELEGLSVEPFSSEDVESKFDLTVYLSEEGEELLLKLVYNADLFDAARMEHFLEQYTHLLDQIVADPERSIWSYSLVTPRAKDVLPDPRAEIVSSWEGAVSKRVSRWARDFPERTAIAGPDATVSYQQLAEATRRLTGYLQGGGIGPEDVVAIYAARDPSLVWTLQGIEKAGAAFLMLDPAYPPARLIDLLEAVGPKAFIELEAAGTIPEELSRYLDSGSLSCKLVVPRDPDGLPVPPGAEITDSTVGIDPAPQSLHSVAMTSGTMGGSKAIAIPHLGMSQSVQWYTREFDLTESDRFCMVSGLTFQPLLREIYSPLWIGGLLCVPSLADFDEPRRLVDWMRREKISVAQLTPAMSQMLTGQGDGADSATLAGVPELDALRYVSFTGDVLRKGDVDRIQRLAPGAVCMNFYGVSEKIGPASCEVIPDRASVVEAERLQPGSSTVSSGRGIEGVQLLLLDKNDEQTGMGELGEICLRSPYLSRGYLDQELTRRKFTINPLTGVEEDRIYRTGDVGRYLPDGRVAHAGRADDQVQIRGFRVEPGEVAEELGKHPDIRAVTVVGREDVPGDRRLVAYVVPAPGVDLTIPILRTFLQQTLPGYMIPSAFVMMDALPMTPRGKIDRPSLPAPPSSRGMMEQEYEAPGTPIEEIIAEIWSEVLEIEKVGRQDDFFMLGGHSLLATQVIVRIRQTFDIGLEVRTLFEESTLASLSADVERRLEEEYGREALDELMEEFREQDD